MDINTFEISKLKTAILSMRDPKDSWDRSDSFEDYYGKFIIGEKDLELASSLVIAGKEHSKFTRMIDATAIVIAPRYFWVEYDTYKIGTVTNSCSTMHKLKDYPITIDMFETEENFEDIDEEHWHYTIKYLEELRQRYNDKKDIETFRKLKQALPESFLQRRTICLNYQTIRTMYFQREKHPLSEWHQRFCRWVDTLPYAKELITIRKKEKNND